MWISPFRAFKIIVVVESLVLGKHALRSRHEATYIFHGEPNKAVTHLRIMGNIRGGEAKLCDRKMRTQMRTSPVLFRNQMLMLSLLVKFNIYSHSRLYWACARTEAHTDTPLTIVLLKKTLVSSSRYYTSPTCTHLQNAHNTHAQITEFIYERHIKCKPVINGTDFQAVSLRIQKFVSKVVGNTEVLPELGYFVQSFASPASVNHAFP